MNVKEGLYAIRPAIYEEVGRPNLIESNVNSDIFDVSVAQPATGTTAVDAFAAYGCRVAITDVAKQIVHQVGRPNLMESSGETSATSTPLFLSFPASQPPSPYGSVQHLYPDATCVPPARGRTVIPAGSSSGHSASEQQQRSTRSTLVNAKEGVYAIRPAIYEAVGEAQPMDTGNKPHTVQMPPNAAYQTVGAKTPHTCEYTFAVTNSVSRRMKKHAYINTLDGVSKIGQAWGRSSNI